MIILPEKLLNTVYSTRVGCCLNTPPDTPPNTNPNTPPGNLTTTDAVKFSLHYAESISLLLNVAIVPSLGKNIFLVRAQLFPGQ